MLGYPYQETDSRGKRVAPVDSAQNARTIREDTAELASYLLSDRQTQGSPAFLNRSRRSISGENLAAPEGLDIENTDTLTRGDDTIPEVSEPSSPERSEQAQAEEEDGPSALANLLRRSPPESVVPDAPLEGRRKADGPPEEEEEGGGGVGEGSVQKPRPPLTHHLVEPDRGPEEVTEHTPLLSGPSSGRESPDVDVEGQKKPPPKPWFLGRLADRAHGAEHRASRTLAIAFKPKSWDLGAIYQSAVVAPASSLPAVCVGLLLNILDALSYGKGSFISFFFFFFLARSYFQKRAVVDIHHQA